MYSLKNLRGSQDGKWVNITARELLRWKMKLSNNFYKTVSECNRVQYLSFFPLISSSFGIIV